MAKDDMGDVVLRIHFTADDLRRTRVAQEPERMWEIVLSLQLLQGHERPTIFTEWRKFALPRLAHRVRMLMTLAPRASYFPDFLTPATGQAPVEAGIDAVLATSRQRMRAEVDLLRTVRPAPAWTGRFAEGDRELRRLFEETLLVYHRAAVEPVWDVVRSRVEADRVRRLRAFAHGGVDGLLNSFRPTMRWRHPVLEADYPMPHELRLAGRGLLLVPAFFCWRTPVTLVDPELPPVLVYPVEHAGLGDDPAVPALDSADHALDALVGRTRAGVLRAVADGCSTTELARRAGVSAASVSQHTAVLRDAGLLETQRYGGSVLHSLTPLGFTLASGRHDEFRVT